jgi:hypothetical protein
MLAGAQPQRKDFLLAHAVSKKLFCPARFCTRKKLEKSLFFYMAGATNKPELRPLVLRDHV